MLDCENWLCGMPLELGKKSNCDADDSIWSGCDARRLIIGNNDGDVGHEGM